jgi:ubiquinone/menaquinone biosynthesis C-methylase UbiE
VSAWDDAENARRYDAFARRFPMYDRTSSDLVGRLGVTPGATVVDLCCGTGRTTRAVLAVLGAAGQVIGVDGSAAMLEIARRNVTDARVSWVETRAEEFDRHLAEPVDAVVCNSAIWQTDIPATFAAAKRALRPGGRLVFNIGQRFLRPADGPTLGEAMREVAAREFGWTVPRSADPGPQLSAGALREALADAGFEADPVARFEFVQEAEEQRAWLSIPLFTDRLLPGLGYEQRMAVLAKAYTEQDLVSQWAVFGATARTP